MKAPSADAPEINIYRNMAGLLAQGAELILEKGWIRNMRVMRRYRTKALNHGGSMSSVSFVDLPSPLHRVKDLTCYLLTDILGTILILI